MISATRRPKYEQVADDLRANITNGTYSVGAALPSAAALMASYQVSVTVARAANCKRRDWPRVNPAKAST